jgi:hypothetical protein
MAIPAIVGACASAPEPEEPLRPQAALAAQQRGASELACPSATSQVVRGETLQEPQGTGWYERPHRAEYTVNVSGCGKQTTYSVACDDRSKTHCVAGPVATVVAPQELADKLQPGAVKVAQEQGAADLSCPAATANVLRKETVEEPQGTGWYQSPQHALYGITVSGCGKQKQYLVACDKLKDKCVAGAPVAAPTGSAVPQLADRLEPDAVRAAQQAAVAALDCAAATAEVLRQETLEEPQTTGWYERPHRAVYTMRVAGCGHQATYLVACDDRSKKGCVASRSAQSTAGE